VRTALITGIAGQDGAYLARVLRGRGMSVIGTVPDVPLPAGFVEAYLPDVDVRVVDLTDATGMRDLLDSKRPEEIYNLASISSVGQSWDQPLPVAQINGVAFLGLLERIRGLREETGYDPRICQASSSEMFGPPSQLPQTPDDPIRPTNPYAVAKSFAHFSAINYRQAYGMFVATVILFNHESPLRPPSFVTRKITSAAAEIAAGRREFLDLGRLDIRRDWGAASDYVEAMSLALQHHTPDDFCVATGESHALEDFVQAAFSAAGLSEPGAYLRSDPDLLRPVDIPETRGDPTRAETVLGWRREVSFSELVATMVEVEERRLATGIEHDASYLR
jgi:GDPmannose 4,6-dehydratase